jgi:class 3 adenylate cyclase
LTYLFLTNYISALRPLLKEIGDAESMAKRGPAAMLLGPERGTAAAAPAAPHDNAGRRQVTVMFSDLVGSTALSARMD